MALIVGLFTPRAGRHAFRDEVSAFAADLRAQAIARIDSGTDTVGALLGRAAELEARARLIGAGSARGYRLMRGTDRVLAAALMLLEAAGAAHALAAEVPGLRERALSVLRAKGGRSMARWRGSRARMRRCGRHPPRCRPGATSRWPRMRPACAPGATPGGRFWARASR